MPNNNVKIYGGESSVRDRKCARATSRCWILDSATRSWKDAPEDSGTSKQQASPYAYDANDARRTSELTRDLLFGRRIRMYTHENLSGKLNEDKAAVSIPVRATWNSSLESKILYRIWKIERQEHSLTWRPWCGARSRNTWLASSATGCTDSCC